MHRLAVFSTLYRGTQLAAAIASRNPTRLAWVGVYPRDLAQPMTREFLRNRGLSIFPEAGRAYHLRIFEVDKNLVEADVSIGETQLLNPRSLFAFDDGSLIEQLDRLDVPVERLELPYKSNYPI